ncbi:MAG: hypothetical protein IKQ36_07285 [Clostridia bacterium]|nr:hypothetical protein [Clostridia bacterium]
MQILYEDNHIIVVIKPVNVPVQGDDTGDPDMLTLLKAYIKEKYQKPGEVYLGLVHRLDRPVGGVMVFARTSKAASRLMPQFAEKNRAGAVKRYAAVTGDGVPDRGRLEGFILRSESERRSYVVPEGTEGAKSAALDYTAVCRRDGLALLDIELHTGRHHQIRAQLAHAGFPIRGDQKYDPEARPGLQIALFARSLSFEHPTLHERMTFTAVPDYGLFKRFSNELRLLNAGLNCPYSDEDVIVLNKPDGVTVANADGGSDTLEARLAAAGFTCFPVHRLDAKTQGLILFARNTGAKEALDSAIRARAIDKYYRLITCGCPPSGSGTLRLYAVKDPASGLMRVFDEPVKNSLEMITDYRVIKQSGGACLIEARLVTGRTHQLRASFAHIGCPIIGDDKYGSREVNRDPRFRPLLRRAPLLLAAVRLELHFEKGSCLERLNGLTLSAEAPFGL